VNEVAEFSKYDRYLAGSEVVVYTCRRHPIVLAKAAVIWVGTLLLSVVLAVSGGTGQAFNNMVGLAFLLVTLYFLGSFGEWWVDHYVITNKRVIKVEGIINRRVSTIPLGKITDTSYRRTWLGRLLGYGDMVLDTPGQDKYLPMLHKLSKPDKVYTLIMSIAIGGGVQPRPRPRREVDTATESHTASKDDTNPISVAGENRGPAGQGR
jgi:PH (Pleckstrin Homology) domain-containing protein